MKKHPYCFDTTAFIQPYRRYYPRDLFPSFWTGLEERIGAGLIVASELVRDEIDQKDDDLKAWVRAQANLFAPMDDEQQQIAAVTIAQFPHWFDPRSTKNNADPFVIALARSRSLTVVSDEIFGGPKNLSIPFVCGKLGVRHISILDYIRETKLRFSTAH